MTKHCYFIIAIFCCLALFVTCTTKEEFADMPTILTQSDNIMFPTRFVIEPMWKAERDILDNYKVNANR